jgi:hypothetical protein
VVPAEDAPLFEAAETRYATSPLCLLDSLLYGKELQPSIGYGFYSKMQTNNGPLTLNFAATFVEAIEATSLM